MSTSDNNQRIRPTLTPTLADEVRNFPIDRQARGLSPETIAWYPKKLAIAGAFFASHVILQTADVRAAHIRVLLVLLGKKHDAGDVDLRSGSVLIVRGKGGIGMSGHRSFTECRA